MRTRVLNGGGAVLCAAVLALWGLPVQPDANAAGKPLGFALEPVGHPSYFVMKAQRGETVRGRVRLRSTSSRDRTVMLTAADAGTAAAGGVDFGQYGASPGAGGTGRWVALSERRVRLAAGAAVEVPFTVRVPATARSGDHFAGIVAFQRPRGRKRDDGRQFQLRFVSRVAVTIQLVLPGPRRPALELVEKSIKVAPVGASLALDLRNRGNTLIRKTSGNVTVRQNGRRLFSRRVRIDAFVPDTSITYAVPWPGVPVEGEYEVEGFLDPDGAAPVSLDGTVSFGRERIREFERETGQPAIENSGPSLALIALLIAATVALALVGTAYLRLRRRV